jgi:type I restriction enzyme S subunit
MVSKENIPEHWDWKKLDDTGEIYSGGTPSRENESYFGGEIPWLRLKDAKEFYVDSTKENLTEKGLNNSYFTNSKTGSTTVTTEAGNFCPEPARKSPASLFTLN